MPIMSNSLKKIMKKVALINNWPITSGVGRYAITLHNSLMNLSIPMQVEVDQFFISRERSMLYKISNGEIKCIRKIKKNISHNLGIALSNLFSDYRFGMSIPNNYDLYHIANQNMSILNFYSNIDKNIITVHDIAYFRYPINSLQKALSKLLYRGFKNSNFLISISNSTKNDLIKYFKISEEKIRVIYHGIDKAFKPLDQLDIEGIYTKYHLEKDCRYILHMGSNAPRKNIPTLIKAFYKLVIKAGMKNVKLLKINNMDHGLIRKLNIEKYVRIIDHIPEEDLQKFYNLADLFVFPSLFEGFGFPPLEAMACGTPVITSNTSSLPEVVGNAGIMLQPNDIDGFAGAMYEVLMNENLRNDMIEKGLEQAKKFNWKKCARDTLEVYEKAIDR